AALEDGEGAALLYESADAHSWTYRGPFLARPAEPVTGGGETGTGWECPQYARFGEHGLLIISAWKPDTGPLGTVAYPGREVDGTFTCEPPIVLDYGPDFYAPALLPATRPGGLDRWLLWGWSPEARAAERVKEAGWAGL